MLSNAHYATIIPIKKMSRALKFYTESLGGKVLYRGEGDMKDSWAAVRVAKADFWLVTPEKWEKRELSYSVFLVKDVKRTVKDLQKTGGQVRAWREDGRGEPGGGADYI